MITADYVRSGQERAYADSYSVWQIKADANETDEEIIEYCFTHLYRSKVPSYQEWVKEFNTKGSEHYNDFGYYFAGYYRLSRSYRGPEWRRFSVCRPYTD